MVTMPLFTFLLDGEVYFCPASNCKQQERHAGHENHSKCWPGHHHFGKEWNE